jgi:hypothetical protein
MTKNSWILKQIYTDAKNNLGWLFKVVLLAGGFIAGIKYDRASKRYMKKLKGGK